MAVQIKQTETGEYELPYGRWWRGFTGAVSSYLAGVSLPPMPPPGEKPQAYLVRLPGGEDWLVKPDELNTFLPEHVSEGMPPMIVPLTRDEAASALPSDPNAPTLPATSRTGPVGPEGVQGPAGPLTRGAARDMPLHPGIERTADGTYQLMREVRLAAIVKQGQRADRDPNKLAGSLNAPLVPYAADRTQKNLSPRPWGETEPTAPIVPYSEEDVVEPGTWGAPEKVGRLQHRLVNAGFLTGDFKYGMYDESTEAAYRQLLTFSSKQGFNMIEGLVEAHKARKWAAENGVPWESMAGTGESGASALKPRYQPPDKAEVRQTIRAQFKAELGRNPEPGELTRFAAQYLENDRADFEGQLREQYGAPEDLPDNVFDEAPSLVHTAEGDSGTAGIGQERINPSARFLESFQQKYGGVMRFKDAQAASAESDDLLSSILGTVDQVA